MAVAKSVPELDTVNVAVTATTPYRFADLRMGGEAEPCIRKY